jgi:uncharacterized membrane protein
MATTERSSRQAGAQREVWPRMGSHEINMSEMERTLSVVGGAALVMFGVSRMPKTSLILLAGGLYAMYRGASGHCNVYEQLGIDHGE